ncbi:MAG: protein translocase subunit SecD [Candidatus Latescibacteria bacterium]|nr:protein translocase subunit SecD [Candidatus Latescibacterota bacterium]
MVQKSVKLRSSSKETFATTWRVVFIVALVLFSLWELIPTYRYYTKTNEQLSEMDPSDLSKLKSKALNLGLDLQGGIHLVMQVDTSKLEDDEAKKDAVDKAMTVIANRVDQFGLTEPIVQKQGDNRVIIELPGMRDVDRAKNLIGQTAQLEFKLLKNDDEIKFVIEKMDMYLSGTADSTAVADSSVVADTTAAALFEEDMKLDTSKRKFYGDMFKFYETGGSPRTNIVVEKEDIPRVNAYLNNPEIKRILENRGVMLLWGPESKREDESREIYLVDAKNEMTGEYISDARVAMGSGMDAGKPEVQMDTSREGTGEWARITGANVGNRIAIVLDNTVYSAGVIREKIYGGNTRISGGFTNEKAKDLAIVLRAGALPASVDIIEDRTVGPSLGADSIRKSKAALLIGLILVILFMIAYYFGAGVIAVIALFMNMLFILAYLAYFRATLTLPGMAGIILTIGMAVDANVLVFERIREELRLGNTTRVAVNNGYLRARWTILDSNITTFLTAIILYNFGTGPIRGFALTLMVGIVASVFTALFVTRVMFNILTHRIALSKTTLGVLSPFTDSKFQFITFRRKAFVMSGIVILAGLISLAVHGGPKYSIDFLGGSLFELHFDKPVTVGEIRDSLREVDVKGTDLSTSEIKFIGTENKDVLIRIVQVGDMSETSEKVKDALRTSFSDRLPENMDEWLLREEQVGPSIGTELKGKALWAIIFSLIVLVVYITIRFEFKYSVGAIVALIHDVLITIGLFSLLNKEISLSIIAALLTIVGYSLNDTIVVFDRIREKLRKGIKGNYLDTLNTSVNETLSRTVITSLTTLLTVLSLYLFGGSVIHDFSFAMLIGIIVGTYSSIFVATPLLVEWYLSFEKRKKVK